MLEYIKNDFIHSGERIECYYSKRKRSLSIRKLDCQSDNFNRIVAHTEVIHLTDVEFVYRGERIIVRGNYVSTLPVIPDNEKMVIENKGQFFMLDGKNVNAASYCVCYLNMILAEGCYVKEQRQNKNL